MPLSKLQRDFMLSMPQDVFGRVDVVRLCDQLDHHEGVEREAVKLLSDLDHELESLDGLTGSEPGDLDDARATVAKLRKLIGGTND